jgi:hypothetical protein
VCVYGEYGEDMCVRRLPLIGFGRAKYRVVRRDGMLGGWQKKLDASAREGTKKPQQCVSFGSLRDDFFDSSRPMSP